MVFKECLVKKKGALPGARFIIMYPPILEGGGGGWGRRNRETLF